LSFPSLEIVDMDGNVNEWNNKTAEITGFTKEEALNRPLVTTFIMPKLRRSVQEVMDNALQGNETSNYELGEDGFIGSGLTAFLFLCDYFSLIRHFRCTPQSSGRSPMRLDTSSLMLPRAETKIITS